MNTSVTGCWNRGVNTAEKHNKNAKFSKHCLWVAKKPLIEISKLKEPVPDRSKTFWAYIYSTQKFKYSNWPLQVMRLFSTIQISKMPALIKWRLKLFLNDFVKNVAMFWNTNVELVFDLNLNFSRFPPHFSIFRNFVIFKTLKEEPGQ